MRRPRRSREPRDRAQVGVMDYGRGHLAPYLPPWAVWAALPLAGTATHAIASASIPTGVAVGAVSGVGVLGLTAFTHHVYKARSESIRLHATATVGAAGLWSLWSTAAGLWQTTGGHGWNLAAWAAGVLNPWPWGAWATVGPLVCAAWNIRRLSQTSTDQQTGDGGLVAGVKIAGRVRQTELEANGSRVRAQIEVQRGTHTIADVQQAIPNIASSLGVRTSAVRVVAHPDDAARGALLVTPRDLLAKPIPWPGPSAPGESIAEQLNVGRYEDGEIGHLWLPGDAAKQRNASHLALTGMSGAGKTQAGLSLLGDAMTRKDFSVVYSDPVKGLQSCRSIAHGVGLLLTDRQSALAGLRGLKTVLTARTTQLGRHGFDQWEPRAALPTDQGGAELRFLVYWMEESADLIADSSTFTELTEQARSAGIVLVLSQQRLSHDRIDTSARANLGAMWCFGVRDDREKFGLSEETFEAGAAPWTWRNEKPGYSYLEAAGIPKDRWALTLRAYLTRADHVADAVSEHADPTLDPTTAAAFGTVYADYQRSVREGAAIWQTGPQATRIPVRGLQQTALDQADQTADREQPEEELDLPIPAGPEPDFMPNIDPAEEIPEDDGPVVEFVAAAPERQLSTEDARRALLHVLTRMAERGDSEVRPAQLVELRRRIGRQAPWLTKELRRLAGDGVITVEAETGCYGLEPLRASQLVGAAR